MSVNTPTSHTPSRPIQTLLSGFQPTGDGRLHLGNLFGSIEPFLAQSQSAESSFAMIADLHALSLGCAPEGLGEARLRCAKELIACGCADDGRFVFAQSAVPAIARLFTLLCFHAPLGDLRRMTQYEDKKERARGEPAGLLLYPALMAADLLALGASHAAVGEDQTQHMELCAQLAKKLSALYGLSLAAPKTLLAQSGSRVKSLSSPEIKMSKSDPSPGGVIFLADDPGARAKKIKRAQTDSELLPELELALEGRLGAKSLLGILASCEGTSVERALAPLAGQGFGALKSKLIDALDRRLSPIQERLERLSDDETLSILERGSQAARAACEPVVARIEAAVAKGALKGAAEGF